MRVSTRFKDYHSPIIVIIFTIIRRIIVLSVNNFFFIIITRKYIVNNNNNTRVSIAVGVCVYWHLTSLPVVAFVKINDFTFNGLKFLCSSNYVTAIIMIIIHPLVCGSSGTSIRYICMIIIIDQTFL